MSASDLRGWEANGTRVHFEWSVGGVDLRQFSHAEQRARLIAAAPELLAALREISLLPGVRVDEAPLLADAAIKRVGGAS
jgi:hypothetical protein